MAEQHQDSLADQHNLNKAKLESLAQPQQTNPLLNRSKLNKKSTSSNSKKKNAQTKKQVQNIKSNELHLISESIQQGQNIVDHDQADVLDLADQLLQQLDQRDAQQAAAAQSNSSSVSSPLPPPDSSSSSATPTTSARGFKEDMLEKLNISPHPSGSGEKKVSRQQARKLRKADQVQQIRNEALAEVEQANDQSIALERKAIDDGCKRLGLWVHEIPPDGHCLYSAIADQVNTLNLTLNREGYKSIRSYAASYMRTHPDEYLPFLETTHDGLMSPDEYAQYCDTVEKTGEWGGQHEISALAKYFQAPIHVLQAGTGLVKIGEDLPPGRGPMYISYHRKMYGLGEHYNSLHR
ncbi:OTU-domain-containing protein [Meredithblackwellia eburnea MCA 4105]